MPTFRSFTRTLLLAALGFALVADESRAALQIRVTAFDSSGNLLVTSGIVPKAFSPPGLESQSLAFNGGGFDVVIATNIASSGGTITDHSLTVNIAYLSGPINPSNQLVIEFIGTSYVNPAASALAGVVSNASLASSGLAASSVAMYSGVFLDNRDLATVATPLTAANAGALGLAGMTTGNGAIISNTSSVLSPNPATAPLALTTPFSFYQALTLGAITTRGGGTINAGSTLSAPEGAPVPEPSTILGALFSLPILGLAALRRRRRTVA